MAMPMVEVLVPRMITLFKAVSAFRGQRVFVFGCKVHTITYKELSCFDNLPGGAVTLADGPIPLVGAAISPWHEIPMEQAVRNALAHGGVRLFDFTYYDGAKGEFGLALTRYLERLRLRRTDVYIVAKFHTDPPLTISSGCSSPDSAPPPTLAEYMSKRVEKCCRELGGYIDLALIRAPIVHEYHPTPARQQEMEGQNRVIETYRLLREYRGRLF